jgi:two-component system phosphate regulon sensor histidine kinase PhoR
LAIAKHIMRAHGGSIRAESELNHGSVFVFTLPTA